MAKAKALPFVDPDASLFVHAAIAVGTRLDEVIEYERYLDDAGEVYELHQMRIAAKRLRYTMDLFQSAFNDFSRYGREFGAAINEVKLLQEHLGDIHDADVLAPTSTKQLNKLLAPALGRDKHGNSRVGVHLVDYDACEGLLTLCRDARSRRDASFEQLKTEWARMHSDGLFDNIRKLLRDAITDQTLATVLHESPISTPEPGKNGADASASESVPKTRASRVGKNGDAPYENKRTARSPRKVNDTNDANG